MHDALPRPEPNADGAGLTDAGVTPSEWHAALGVVLPEFAWQLERITLSRVGRADVVELIGRLDGAARAGDATALTDAAVTLEGNAILSRVLGSAERSRALAARAFPRGGLARGDGCDVPAGTGCGRHGRGCHPRAHRSQRCPRNPAAARPPQLRQPARRPRRYRVPRLRGGS